MVSVVVSLFLIIAILVASWCSKELIKDIASFVAVVISDTLERRKQ